MATPLTSIRGSRPPRPWARPHLDVGTTVTLLLIVLVSMLGGCDAGSAGSEGAATTVAEPDASAAEEGGPGTEELARGVPALHPAIDDLDEAVVTIASGADEHEVVAKVAATADERARGLMEVAALPDGVGMLFLFEQDRTGGFWMWNTLIELDIAFIGDDGVAHTLATMVPCEASRSSDCPVTSPPEPYRAALEVPGGWFERMGIEPGAEVVWNAPRPVGP